MIKDEFIVNATKNGEPYALCVPNVDPDVEVTTLPRIKKIEFSA